MADTGAISPGTMAEDSAVGTLAWSEEDLAKVSDDDYAKTAAFSRFDENLRDNEVKIVKSNGSIGAENKASGNNWDQADPDSYVTYGGAADLWNETWASADINHSNFGVVLAVEDDSATISYYLKATNFGFSIPEGSTINGITVEIERWLYHSGSGYPYAYVDHIRITVYYTEAAVASILPLLRET